MAMTYLCIIAGVVLKLMPTVSLIALASTPFALLAIRTTFKYYDDLQRFIPALKANVITVLATDALLALGYFLSC
jgi:1,4-dihydroxy-2-naphthoate octaprenyltransferase